MTQASSQRATRTAARKGACGVLPAMLLSAAVCAGAQQSPATAADPDTPAPEVRTRGMPVPWASAAAVARTVQPPVTSTRSRDAAAADDQTAGTDARWPAAGLRGVLFRVTPPPGTTLPAEMAQDNSMQAQQEAGGTAMASRNPGVASVASVPHAPSYLLGTIHFGTAEEQGLDYVEIERTLAAVETFVNEADLDEAWRPEYDGYRWLPAGEPLSKMVGKDAYSMARALLPSVRAQDLDRMKPWSVLALLEARGESADEATMDARLQRMAAGAGKRVLHLETLEQQLKALDCVPAAEHVRVLDERLRASWILRIESAQAMAWYRARNLEAWLSDIDRMEGLSEEAKATEQRARRCLLEERNARWLGQLQTLFQDGPCLVAVGAMHLPGAGGLVAALRRDGYRVEAMPL